MKTATRWLYSVDGRAAYYQDGGYICANEGACAFSVSDGWWYAIKGGAAAFYETADGWIYTCDGKPAFYFG